LERKKNYILIWKEGWVETIVKLLSTNFRRKKSWKERKINCNHYHSKKFNNNSKGDF
jgi:hypothetical protein